jgi:Single-strand binding protein family
MTTTFLINHVCLAGKVGDYGCRLTYLPSGKPELQLTLILEKPGTGGKVFRTYVPIQVYGSHAEALAERLEPGDLILIPHGQLSYQSRPVADAKDKRSGMLAVTCFDVQILLPADATVAEA